MALSEKEKEIVRYVVQERGGTVEAMKYVAGLDDADLAQEINSWKVRATERRNMISAELDILNSLLEEESG